MTTPHQYDHNSLVARLFSSKWQHHTSSLGFSARNDNTTTVAFSAWNDNTTSARGDNSLYKTLHTTSLYKYQHQARTSIIHNQQATHNHRQNHSWHNQQGEDAEEEEGGVKWDLILRPSHGQVHMALSSILLPSMSSLSRNVMPSLSPVTGYESMMNAMMCGRNATTKNLVSYRCTMTGSMPGDDSSAAPMDTWVPLNWFTFAKKVLTKFLPQMQDYYDEANCRFTKWVDPPHHGHVQEYIDYLKNKLFDLQQRVQSLEADAEQNAWVISIEGDPLCPDPWCKCPYHRNKDRPPSPPSFGGTASYGGSDQAGTSQFSQSQYY